MILYNHVDCFGDIVKRAVGINRNQMVINKVVVDLARVFNNMAPLPENKAKKGKSSTTQDKKDNNQAKVTDYFSPKVKTIHSSPQPSTSRSHRDHTACSSTLATEEKIESTKKNKCDKADKSSSSSFEFDPMDFSDFLTDDSSVSQSPFKAIKTSESQIQASETNPPTKEQILKEGHQKAKTIFNSMGKSYKVNWSSDIPEDKTFIHGSKCYLEGVVPVRNSVYRSIAFSVDTIKSAASMVVRKLLISEYNITNETFKGKGHSGDPSVAAAILNKLGWAPLNSNQEAIRHCLISKYNYEESMIKI